MEGGGPQCIEGRLHQSLDETDASVGVFVQSDPQKTRRVNAQVAWQILLEGIHPPTKTLNRWRDRGQARADPWGNVVGSITGVIKHLLANS